MDYVSIILVYRPVANQSNESSIWHTCPSIKERLLNLGEVFKQINLMPFTRNKGKVNNENTAQREELFIAQINKD